MTPPPEIVFLVDVDNTLLDNDRFEADLKALLVEGFGEEGRDRYWGILRELRTNIGYVDYLGALERFRTTVPFSAQLVELSFFLLSYPFEERFLPNAHAALTRLRGLAPTVILTDGDIVFQPRKLQRSGILEAVDGEVLIYVHKEQELTDVARRYPAARYALFDDNPRILAAVKQEWGHHVTTVFVRSGHYAHDADEVAKYPPPDCVLEGIGEPITDAQLRAMLSL